MGRRQRTALMLALILAVTTIFSGSLSYAEEDVSGETTAVAEEAEDSALPDEAGASESAEQQSEEASEEFTADIQFEEDSLTPEDAETGVSLTEDTAEDAGTAAAEEESEDTDSVSEDLSDLFSDGGTAGSVTLSHEGIIQEGAIVPKETDAVLYEEWENAFISRFTEGAEVIDIADLGIPEDEISDIVMLFLNKHPEYYWLYLDSCDVENGIAVRLYPRQSADAAGTIHGTTSVEQATANALTVIQAGMSDLEKALALHDYLALNTEYAYEDYLADTLKDSAFTIEGILVEGTGVCQGYALAYQYLLSQVGIESVYIGSALMNHGWNLVKIDGCWYHVDVTWDDPVYDNLGQVLHNYFMVSDVQIQSSEEPHYAWTLYYTSGRAPAATSTVYDDYFWTDIYSGMWYYGGKWYYVEADSTNNIYEIQCRGITDTSAVTIKDLSSMRWPVYGYTGYYLGMTKTVLANGKLYYSGPDAIYQIDLDGGNDLTIKTVESSDGKYIYGFASVNGSFYIVRKTDANEEAVETPEKIDIGFTIATPTPMPTATPVPKPTITLNVSQKKTLPMKKGQKVTIKVSGLMTGDKVVSWKSSKTSVATVKNGKITAKKKGTAKITIKLKSGLTTWFKVKVQNGTVKTTVLKVINKTTGKTAAKTIALAKGQKLKLGTSLAPITSQEKVTYSSSKKSVATVSSKGVIKAKKAGKTVITVTSGSKKYKITVKVTKK